MIFFKEMNKTIKNPLIEDLFEIEPMDNVI